MKNASEILLKIVEAYNDKERENNRLFNWKQMETERINNEIKLLQDQTYQKLIYLQARETHLIEEEKNETDKFISEEQQKNDNFHSDNFYVQLEQNYQTKLSEFNLKLKQISKYEAEKDNLVKELIKLEENRINDREKYVKGKTDIRFEDTANVVRTNYEFSNAQEYQKQVSSILAQIISIEQEIEEKKNIESEIAKLNFERNSIFGKNKPTPALARKKHFDNLENLELDFDVKEEYNKLKSVLNDEAQKVAAEADEGKAKLEMELARISQMPDFSRVYLREMLDLKIELNKILTEQEVSVKTELNNKKVSRDNIINPILAELDEKNTKFDNKTQEYLDLTKKLVDESSPKLSEEQINELEKQISELRNQRIKFKEELDETEKYYNQTLLDIEPLDKEIEKLSKNMEFIANIRKMLQVSDEEAKTATIQFTEEEQEEYNKRYDSQKSRIDNIIRFKESGSIFDLTPPIDSTKLGKRM